MEKVNIVFHDNYTVSYQHRKILEFVPEMSLDKNLRIITPNIPLLVCAILAKNEKKKKLNPVEYHSFGPKRNITLKKFHFSFTLDALQQN